MLHCISLAPAPSLYHCTSMALSCVLLPDLSGGRGLLLLDPPRTILARASATFPRMIQSAEQEWPSTRVKEWEHNNQVCPRKRNATATAADKHTVVWHEG